MRRTARAVPFRFALLAAGLALGTGCGVDCSVDGPLDYADDANWLCRPGVDTACPASYDVAEIAEDGSVTHTTLERVADPPLACFVVYPTLDLRLRKGLHRDTTRLDGPAEWVRTQAGPMQTDCDLWAPVYRQVTIGTYLNSDSEKSQECFDSAYGDVEAAFETFLQQVTTRGFVLLGHSQGGMHLSRLIRERIEPDDALRARLVAAYPIGWSLGTASGSTTGGSFEKVPVCTSDTERGCVIGYRSFMSGSHPPEAGQLQEGAEQVCVDPAAPAASTDPATMSALTAAPGHPVIAVPPAAASADLVRWPAAFEARCVTEDGRPPALEARWRRSDGPPFDLHGLLVTGGNGSHILDMNLGIADIVADAARRAAAR